MNVLSLFDGMSCGRIALQRAGIHVDNYFSSEIDKHALKVSDTNWPCDTPNRLGDVTKIDASKLPKIDLLIGGSPCQSFSFAGTRKGMSTTCEIEILNLKSYLELKEKGFSFSGQSYLFWEYVKILKETKPRFFLLENVKMDKKWERVISETLGVKPVFINSNFVTAHNRKRLYWTNIPFDTESCKNECMLQIGHFFKEPLCDFEKSFAAKDFNFSEFVKSCFENSENLAFVDFNGWTSRFFKKKKGSLAYKKAISQLKSLFEKANCITTSGQNISNSGSTNCVFLTRENKVSIRPLTAEECEALQTVPDGYTNHVTEGARIKMLGNGWTVDVIAHILKGIQNPNV